MLLGSDPEGQAVAAARSWFKCLANEQWEQALAMLDEPNSYGIRWTKELIVDLLNDTFGPNTRFWAQYGAPIFSDPDLATDQHQHSFGNRNDGGFWLDLDVPLNGTYSDLTAQFQFLRRPGGFAFVLHDLHVM